MNPYRTSRPQSFADAFKATHIIETAENYAVADQVNSTVSGGYARSVLTFRDEQDFWEQVLADRDHIHEIPVNLPRVTVSEWVPRVPGLYWDPKAQQIRIDTNDGRAIYDPYSKSQFVLGGIGTLRLSPDANGQRIISVCTSNNVSGGIPVVIPNRVWRSLGLQSGQTLTLKEVWWQAMNENWMQRLDFANIPRAYLCIEDESQVQITGQNNEPTYQPFTVIEYVKDGVELYDYIFCNAYAHQSRDELADFFERYRVNYGYGGRYLLNPDPGVPLFNSAFSSPQHLRQADPGGRYHLDMLRDGIRKAYFNDRQVEHIMQVLSQAYTRNDNIGRIATLLDFPDGGFESNTPADRIVQLVRWCIDFRDNENYVKGGKMEALISILVREQPELLGA